MNRPTPAELAALRGEAEEARFADTSDEYLIDAHARQRRADLILLLVDAYEGLGDADRYQEEAARTLKTETQRDTLNLCALGLGGEAGEVLEAAIAVTAAASKVSERLKKYLFHGKALGEDDLALELGDVQWYTAVAARAIGRPLSAIMRDNIAKLRARNAARLAAETTP